jgi:hypothetical protein
MNVEKYAAAEAAPGACDRIAQTWWTALIIGWIRARSWKRRSCGGKQVEEVEDVRRAGKRAAGGALAVPRWDEVAVTVEAVCGWEGNPGVFCKNLQTIDLFFARVRKSVHSE